MFKGLMHKLDKMFDAPMQRCESCGYEVPMYMIFYSSDGGEYCKSCIYSFREEEYNEEA